MGKWMDKMKSRKTFLDTNTQSLTTIEDNRNTPSIFSSNANHPTLLDTCVGNDLKVSGTQPDTFSQRKTEISSETLNLNNIEVSVVSPDTSPRADPLTPAAVCFALFKHPPIRTEAVERLVATFRPEIREAQQQRWLTTTLSGKPVADAPEAYLLAEAVGLTAWAQDREERGVFNQGAYAWIAAAWQVAERRGHTLKAA